MTDKRVGPGSNPDMASTPGSAMPRPALPGVPSKQPNAGMPTPAMHKTAQEQMQPPAVQAANAGDLPRFPSPSHGPIGPRYEPGVVEAQFRIGLMPRVIPGGPGQAPSLVAGAQSPEAGVPLNDVNDLLRRYQAVSAEPTFTFTVEEGGLPYLSDFVTLHFPADANVVEIAEQLNQLSDVERAAPLPAALPPAGLAGGLPPRPG
jgi:hypothetical protein